MSDDLTANSHSPANLGTTSQEKIEANRKNAQLSTGPKTEEGKKMSSSNAMTHGLLAKEVVITTGEGKEDEAEFQSLLAGLRDYYHPVGIVEDLRVQELAASDWRTARALRCERGVVTIASTLTKDNPELSFDEILRKGLKSSAGARHELLGSSRGLNFLLRNIEEVKEEVASTGYISRESLRWLAPNDIWNGRAGKQAVLEALEKEIAELTTLKAQVEEDEFHQNNARRDSAAIPSTEALDRLYRYETSNRRHRYKVEARLEELQARRKEKGSAGLELHGDAEGKDNS